MIRTRVATVTFSAGLAVFFALGASGCGGSDDDLGSSPPIRDDNTTSLAPDQPSGDGSDNSGMPQEDPQASGDAGPGGDSADASGVPEVSRSTQIEAAEGVAGTLEIGLAGLEADGQLVTLVLVYTPHYDQDPGGTISLFDMFARNVAEVTLVDSVNLRRYLVVEDSRGLELGPFPATVETRNNHPVSASYTFAAPPADVATVDVYIDDRRIFDDVDVAR